MLRLQSSISQNTTGQPTSGANKMLNSPLRSSKPNALEDSNLVSHEALVRPLSRPKNSRNVTVRNSRPLRERNQ